MVKQALHVSAATTYTVTTANNAGAGSLRQAIIDANANAGADEIVFDNAYTIQLSTSLPAITEAVEINGYTNSPGGATANTAVSPAPFDGTLTIEIDGTNIPLDDGDCVIVNDTTGVVIKGLVINNCGNSGILNEGSNGTVIQGNYIGTDATGMTAEPNGRDQTVTSIAYGLEINYSNNVQIGGTDPDDRNIIAANQGGDIFIGNEGDEANPSEDNIIHGNYIGTAADGTTALPSGHADGLGNAILLGNSHDDQIGGTVTGATNVIGSSDEYGVGFRDGASGTTIEGNFIGTDYTGTAAMPHALGAGNISAGIHIGTVSGAGFAREPHNITIGGTTAAQRNIISANSNSGGGQSSGITINDGAYDNTVSGNYIGTDVNGTADLGNEGTGVTLGESPTGNTTGNVVGGTTAGERNIISGNGNAGVGFEGADTEGNTLSGNYIGTDVNGSADLGNSGSGVLIGVSAASNTVGGTSAGARNIISGNQQSGVYISGANSDSNTVSGNYIGTAANGTSALGNSEIGVRIDSGAASNTIGGTTAGARNVISSNSNGVTLRGADTDSNTVAANYIGTDVNGTADLGNTFAGVGLEDGAASNTIGGTTAGARNIISGNNGNGISVTDSDTDSNTIAGNYIGTDVNGTAGLGNSAQGIDLSNGPAFNTIGGTVAGARNIISSNSAGIIIGDADTDSNTVSGNYIGTDVNGTADLGNNSGVVINDGAASNTIGGTTTGARNVISGNSIGVDVQDADTDNNTVSGNYIGTDVNGTADLGNTFVGVTINNGAATNTVGGTTSGAGNVISGNGTNGVTIDDADTDSTTVAGNHIGVNASGAAALSNTDLGIIVDDQADGTIIGGTTTAARNVISGNGSTGVSVTASATNTDITGNYIGINAAGTAAIANGGDGVIMAANDSSVGSAVTGGGNVISGNTGLGISLTGDTNVVAGNYIGTNAAGTAGVANGSAGVTVDSGASGNTIGGTTSLARNVISSNTTNGVTLNGTSNTISGNYIGTDATGTADLGNGQAGIAYAGSGSGNVIGGTASGARNIISGNAQAGIVAGGSNLTIQGNYLGLDVTGTAVIANIGASNNANLAITGSSNTIGGTAAGAGNVISGTPNVGVAVLGLTPFGGAQAANNIIQGNMIGTNADGEVETGFGNAGAGVQTALDVVNTLIGGTVDGAANIIAGNGSGVAIVTFTGGTPAINNSILGNSIHSNSGGTPSSIGIDLLQTADFSTFVNTNVTVNDANDIDFGGTNTGSNHYLNFPEISAVTSADGSANITYNLDINNSESGATGYRVEFFASDSPDATGYGQGETYLGSDTVSGDVTGRTASLTLPAGFSGAKYISATTTMSDNSSDGFGHSSEFSQNVQATLAASSSGGGGGGSSSSDLADTGIHRAVWIAVATVLLASGALFTQSVVRKRRA